MEALEKGSVYTAVIDGYSSEGLGIARVNGAVVFVPHAVRGEEIDLRITKVMKTSCAGEIVKIHNPSPERMEPECPYAGKCGGCAYRHLTYPEELWAKRQRVQDALTRIGGLELTVEEILGAKNPEHYRNKSQYPVGADGSIGFFQARTHKVVPIRRCLIQTEAADRTAQAVGEWMRRYKISAYDETTGKGLVRHVCVRVNRKGESLCCVVVNGNKVPREPELAAYVTAAVPHTVGVLLNSNTRRGNVVLGDKYRTLFGRNYLMDTLCGLEFKLSMPSFYQVNRDQAEVLYGKALDYAALTGEETVLDLYCGTGTITLWHKSSSGSSSGAVTPGTKTDTVKNPDGSTTKTETKADGSKTETTTASSGGGSTGTTVTKTDAKGNTTTEASAKLSDRDVKEAQEKGEAVSVPVKGIAAAKDANAATKIKIDVPNNANKTTVEIPVENVTSGTVAVIVHEDGTEELVKDSKPTEGGVQLELSGSTTVKIIDNSKTFDDTKDHWSRDEVNFVAARELFNGVGGNQFGVSQPMTRGMVNTVLARLAGVDTTPGQGQAWYEVGTDWAKKNGISDGTNPTAPVTREQLATLLYRYAGSPSVSGTLHAADAASVSDYAEDALLWANQNGIVNGVGSNTIAPKDNAQRAQVAAMLARYLKNQ